MSAITAIRDWFGSDSKRLLYTILVSAFIIRLGFVLVLDSEKFYFSDTRHFDGAATSIMEGNGFGEKYTRAPFYPVVLAVIYAVLGHSFVAARIVEVLFAVGIVLLVFLNASIIFNKKVALVAAGISAFFPHFILIPGILYSTNVFTFLLALCFYLLLRYEKSNNLVFLITCAFVSGLTALTIPSFFFILPFWLLWIALSSLKKIGLNIGKAILFLGIFGLTLAPWTIRNYHIYGRFTLVRPIPNTVLPDLENLEAQKAEIKSGFKATTDYLKENPHGTEKDNVGNMFVHYLKNPVGAAKYIISELGHFYALYPDRMDTANPKYHAKIHKSDKRFANTFGGKWGMVKLASIMVMAPIFLFALIGLFVGKVNRRTPLLLLSTIIPVSVGYSMILAEVRYRIPVEPYILMFSAVGILWLFEKIRLKNMPKI